MHKFPGSFGNFRFNRFEHAPQNTEAESRIPEVIIREFRE